MIGKKNSVLSRIREQQPDVFDLGCLCHLANIALGHSMKKLPMNIEELLVDIFYHFNNSSKRKEQYKEFLEFTETEPLKIVKHCATRWLSLEKVIKRTLHQWSALSSYFNSHEDVDHPGRVQRVAHNLTNIEMEIYVLFLDFILPHLNQFNTMFQSESCLIVDMVTQMKALLKTFLGKFVKVSAIKSVKDITEVDYSNEDNYLPVELLAMGMKARTVIANNEDNLEPPTLQRIYRSIREFYVTMVRSMVTKFPFDDELLNGISFVNPDHRETSSFENVSKINKRFGLVEDMDQLQEEFLNFQLAETSEIPKYEPDQLDQFWAEMSRKISVTGTPEYKQLSRLCLTILSLPNSNAGVERSFSVLRKIEQESRGNLAHHTTSSIMSVKFNMDISYANFKPDKQLLTQCKKSYLTYKDRIQKKTE